MLTVQNTSAYREGSGSSTSTTRPRKKPGVADNLATHVPDFVLATSNIGSLPYSQKFEGILLFADISGFTALCERYSMDSRNASGTDKLSRTLNSYLSDIIDNIMGSEGDILKFAGDAFMCLWKIKAGNVDYIINRVIQCGLRIQRRCDNRHTDIGVNLRVKLGVAIGHVRVTTIGNVESRHYVLSGPAVDDANKAEKYSQPGTFVLGPKAWAYTPDQEKYEYEVLSDKKHVSILSYLSGAGSDAGNMTVNEKIAQQMAGNYSTLKTSNRYTSADVQTAFNSFRRASGVNEIQDMSESLQNALRKSAPPMASTIEEEEEDIEEEFAEDAAGRIRQAIYRSPTDDEKARLRKYIIKPVLQKIDDDLPLEYLSEMRQVSVLFINLVFESLGDKRDRGAGELRSLQAAFTAIYDTANEFKGCLNKVFMFDKGCTYIVIFGLPGFKHEDDCSRALRAAYSMSTKLENSPNISQVSIGVTSGSSFCGVVGHVHRHEYTVIGKKVNMAARLMMHYPGKVSCDPETFHHSKLARHYFHELPQKEMKGVRNPGIIHEFIERDDYVPSNVTAKEVPMFQYPMLGRDKEMAMFLKELHAVEEKRHEGEHVPFIFIYGDAGMGKTRFLDAAIEEALQDNDKVISCALSMNDSSTPYFIVKALISMLLGMENCNSHVEREHQILYHIQEEKVREELCLLNDLLVVKFPTNPKFVHMNSEQQTLALHTLIRKIVHMFTRHQCVIFAVDDAHFMDNDSWEFLDDFAEDDSAVFLLTMRPFTSDKPPGCEAAERVVNHAEALHLRLYGLESEFMAPLACQLLEVVQVPEALVKILKEKSHGLASWCEQLIREMISEDQLQVVPMNKAAVNAPSVTADEEVMRKRRESTASTGSFARGSRRGSLAPSDMVSSIPQGDLLPATQLLQHLQQFQEKSRAKEEDKKICIVSPGVDLSDIQVPDSMKGIILTRIDHMKPTEQMIVKLASVLGLIFTRKLLEVISPTNSSWKLRQLLYGLMKSGVFECAASHFNHMGVMQPDSITRHRSSRHHIQKSSHVSCECPDPENADQVMIGVEIPLDDLQTHPVSNCRYIRFTSSLMQETAYDMFLIDQRRRLHRSAALFLESQAHKCEACGGGEFMPGHETAASGLYAKRAFTPAKLSDSNVNGDNDEDATDKTLMNKTSKLFESMQQSIKRRSSKVNPVEEPNDADGDEDEDLETISEKEEEEDEVADLPPVPLEVFGRRGRRNTITIHRSSVVPDDVVKVSGSLISLTDELDQQTTIFEDSDGLIIESHLDLRECCCLEILTSVFPHLVRHWKAAANTARTILFLTEAGGAAIATGNNISALSYLHEANDMIQSLDKGNKPLPDDPEDVVVSTEDRARIESMTGQALFRMGRIEESMPHFQSSLRILCNRQPTTKFGLVVRLIAETRKQALHTIMPSLCIGSASSSKCNRYVEQARCLSFIWDAYHGENLKWKALAAALQELNRAESADDDLKELVKAYTNMMQCCQSNKWHKLGDYYEKLAMKRCIESPGAVGPDDLITIGYLYCSSMVVRLANGRIQGAIDTGFSTLKVAKKLHDVAMEIQVLPLLAQTLLLANRLVQCVDMINKLNYAAREEEDPIAKCLYYCCCMDLALSTGFALVSPESCEDYCRNTAGEPSFSFDDARFCLMACLALWFSRKGMWDKSEEWIKAAEKVRPNSRLTYITVHGTFKLVECNMIHFCHSLRMRITSEQAGRDAKKSLEAVKMTTKRFPVFHPRYLHLQAYLHLLYGNPSASQKGLSRCMTKALRLGNMEEHEWAEHNKSVWFDESMKIKQSEFWMRSHHMDISQQPNIANAVVTKYSLPHPSWQKT